MSKIRWNIKTAEPASEDKPVEADAELALDDDGDLSLMINGVHVLCVISRPESSNFGEIETRYLNIENKEKLKHVLRFNKNSAMMVTP